jgi:putative ABC transport system permease protein
MRAVWTKILADLRQRRVQTAVVAVLVVLASGSSVVAANLLAQGGHPWDEAFQQQRGAHLQAYFDAHLVSGPDLSATPTVIGAAAAAGPWPRAAGVNFQRGSTKFNLSVVGRADPGGAVEQLRITSGRWAQQADEIVITRSFANLQRIAIGQSIQALSRPDKPALRVVGEVIDVDEPDASASDQSAWVLPDQVARLVPDQASLEMAYRFPGAPTKNDLGAALDRLKAAFPAGALTGSASYLNTKAVVGTTDSFILSFLVAFSLVALGAAAVMVGNVVAGAVLTGYREIGIMKAIGYTRGQVVAVFTGQMLLTALIGCIVGIPLGVLISGPLLESSALALGLPAPPTVVVSLELLVLAGVLAVVALASVIPAMRAASLSPVQAIVMGTAPQRRRAAILAGLLNRIRAPRPISLGVADAFARPLRGTMTAIGILVGVATVTFATGLAGTFVELITDSPLNYVQAQVSRIGNYPDDKVMTTLMSQPETQTVVAEAQSRVVVPGVPDFVNGVAFRGEPQRIGYGLTGGHWYSKPGDALASPGLMKAAHVQLGDTIMVTVAGHPTQLRIVGQILERLNLAHELFYDWSTYTAIVPDAVPQTYLVSLKHGANATAYIDRVQQTEPDFLTVSSFGIGGGLSPLTLLNLVVLILALLLSVMAILGVFNTVLLGTRERIRDTAILKALGMSPRQVLVMVAASAAVLGVVGGVVGTPLGVALHRVVMGFAGEASGNVFPPAALDVFNPTILVLVALGGILVAIVGALLPAHWASRGPVVQVLRTE